MKSYLIYKIYNILKRVYIFIYMRVKHFVSIAQICRRVVRRLHTHYPNSKYEFKAGNCYPVKYEFYCGDRKTQFSFNYETIQKLLDHSTMTNNPYDFVIDAIYNSCLAEIVNKGGWVE